MDIDLAVRTTAFKWLSDQVVIHGDELSRELLIQGFIFEEKRIPLVSPQGIFKPKILDLPLSITTVSNGPYDDKSTDEGYILYKYRGTDPYHRDNVGLRMALEKGKPLIYFYGLKPGIYVPTWPVYIISDDPYNLTFKVAVDDISMLGEENVPYDKVAEDSNTRRAYITATVRQRLHQRSFRERVLDAYRSQCAFCQLRHRDLLDAAHIIPDNEPEGRPTVDNGLSLCKLHHAAFDRFMFAVTPDYIIEVRQDILHEKDGPILQHGFKNLHRSNLILPTKEIHWPNKNFLEQRYEKFKKAM